MAHAHVFPELDALLVSPEIMENPYPIYTRLRDEAPVFWSEQWQAWVVSRYDYVAASLKDKENLSNENRQALLFDGLMDKEREMLSVLRHYFSQKDVIGSDPPDHTRMRALVQKTFTPKRVASLEPRVRALAESMIVEAMKQGGFDFVSEVAHPLPVVLIAEMLGAPAEDRHLFKRWSSDILAFQGTGRTTFGPAMVSQTSLVEMFDYMNLLIDSRRSNPKDDIITALALAEEGGKPFSRAELLATCNTLLTAGHETTTNLIGNLVHLLLAHSDQWRQLERAPDLLPSAIEEALRFEAPKQRNFRRIKRSHIFAGAPFEENQMVFQFIGAANRDPSKFNNADSFDITRQKNEHLSFGAGIHFCLGAPLARMEARIVLETLIAAIPNCRLGEQSLLWQDRVQFRGPKELWISEGCR
jgi:cytochrome P450